MNLRMPTLLALGVADAEDTVPEQAELLQRARRVHHPEGPVGLVALNVAYVLPANEVPFQQPTSTGAIPWICRMRLREKLSSPVKGTEDL